jgi:hypothetical protein
MKEIEVDTVHVVSIRPVVAIVSNGLEAPTLEVAGTRGEHLVLSMSGEGMKKIAESMLKFLEEHPQLAKTKSPPRQ